MWYILKIMESTKERIEEVLTRGVGEFFDPDNVFRKKLEAKTRGEVGEVVIKHGVDPSRPDIHLGHAVVLRKLRQFQDLGCRVVFLIGDYTAQIGDPTGKSKTRPEIEQKEVDKNMKTYVDQVDKILRTDPEVFSWIRNSDWFYNITDIATEGVGTVNLEIEGKCVNLDANSLIGKTLLYENTRMQRAVKNNKQLVTITLRSLLWTLKNITHSRLIQRDMFQDRLKNNEELYMHEMLYPVLQGIDSFVMSKIYGSCDLEIGGTDQTFNMLLGRDIMKINKTPPQAVLSLKILVGTDGKEKMSKSLDNYIGITEPAENIFGKVMSLPDRVMPEYFELATYSPIEEIEEIKKEISSGSKNPRDIKLRLAEEITAIYHGEGEAKKTKEQFVATFSRRETPTEVITVEAQKDETLADLLVRTGFASSKTEVKRLEREKAIHFIEGESFGTLESFDNKKGEWVLRIGSHRFLRIKSE